MTGYYPRLYVDLDAVADNACVMRREMAARGLAVCGVAKVADVAVPVAEAYMKSGLSQIAGSRVAQVKAYKQAHPEWTTMLLRAPSLCDVPGAVTWADICIVTDLQTARWLNEEAKRQKKTTAALIMADIGDRRDGITDPNELTELGVFIEKCSNLKLVGIAANYCCVSGLLPDDENLEQFASFAEKLTSAVGHPLEIISGGNSTLLLRIYSGEELPGIINHIRLGGTIINPYNMKLNRGFAFPDLNMDTVRLEAQISEIRDKPPAPVLQPGKNWKGEEVTFSSTGVRKRAIINLGCMDIGDPYNLLPFDDSITVIASSSDHTVLDITDCWKPLKVVDTVSFRLRYAGLMYCFAGRHVTIEYSRRCL